MRGGWAVLEIKARHGELPQSGLVQPPLSNIGPGPLSNVGGDSFRSGQRKPRTGLPRWCKSIPKPIDAPAAARNQYRVTISPIIPTARREAFDGPEWTFELKYDGFRAIADTVNGRMLSKRGNRMHRFEALLGALPADCVLDGEIVALDATGRPMFADLMFGRRPPIFVAFDVLAFGPSASNVACLMSRLRRGLSCHRGRC